MVNFFILNKSWANRKLKNKSWSYTHSKTKLKRFTIRLQNISLFLIFIFINLMEKVILKSFTKVLPNKKLKKNENLTNSIHPPSQNSVASQIFFGRALALVSCLVRIRCIVGIRCIVWIECLVCWWYVTSSHTYGWKVEWCVSCCYWVWQKKGAG